MKSDPVDAGLTTLSRTGFCDTNVVIGAVKSADHVLDGKGIGKILDNGYVAINKTFTVSRKAALLLITTSFGPLELAEGDTITLHRGVGSRALGVSIVRKELVGFGNHIVTSCTNIKGILPKKVS